MPIPTLTSFKGTDADAPALIQNIFKGRRSIQTRNETRHFLQEKLIDTVQLGGLEFLKVLESLGFSLFDQNTQCIADSVIHCTFDLDYLRNMKPIGFFVVLLASPRVIDKDLLQPINGSVVIKTRPSPKVPLELSNGHKISVL